MSKRRIKYADLKAFKTGFIVLSCISFCLNLIGCVSLPATTQVTPNLNIPGFYHRVERGQTLWKISKIYNIDLDELIKINHISDVTNIEIGQMLFIPRQQKQQRVSLLESTLEDFIWPVNGKVIAAFGETFDHMVNKGINIQPSNNSDVRASRSGKVVFHSLNFKGYGKTIIIDHGDGFLTVYTKNSQVFAKLGDFVSKGSVIAKVGPAGNTGGENSYLHFEIRKGYIPQNPYYYLSR